jgi:hypothetical protein
MHKRKKKQISRIKLITFISKIGQWQHADTTTDQGYDRHLSRIHPIPTRCVPQITTVHNWLFIGGGHGSKQVTSVTYTLWVTYMVWPMSVAQQVIGPATICWTLHYITFPGSKVSQNYCRMWNKSYKYKDAYTVQWKHSKSTSWSPNYDCLRLWSYIFNRPG